MTLTTVDYGDAVPITSLGKIFGGFITVMDIYFYALPTGILSSSYTGKMQLKRDRFKDTVRSALDDGVLSFRIYDLDQRPIGVTHESIIFQ